MVSRYSRRQVLRSAVGAAGLALAGCTPSTPAATSVTTAPRGPKRGGSLVLAGQNATNLDPNRITGAGDLYYSSLCYNQLVRWYREPERGFGPDPELAQSWEITPDGLTAIFKIRPGVKFQNVAPVNGRELTAADAKWTIERWAADKPYFPRRTTWGPIQRIEEVDKYTLKLTLAQPWPDLMIQLGNRWSKILAREAVEEAGDDKFNSEGKPHVGTGPFILQEYRRDVGSKWIRNPEYWKSGQPYVDDITVRWFPDPTSKFASVRTGDVADMGFFVTPTQYRILQSTSGVMTAERPGTSWGGIILNMTIKPFDDVRVRRAIAHAIDIDAFVKGPYQGGAIPSRTAIPVSFKEESLPASEWPKRDLARARQLLAEAGYPNGLKFSLMTATSQEESKLGGELLKEQLAAVGIDISLDLVGDVANFVRRSTTKDFEANYLGPWAGDVVLGGYFEVYYLTNATRNFMGYSNPQLDQIITELRRTADPARRKDLAHRAQRILIEDMPVVHLIAPIDYYAWQGWFKGFSPTWHPGSMVSYVDEFWIDR